MFYQIEFPTTTGFLELPLVIPAFMQQQAQIFIALKPGSCVIQQHLELGERPRGNHITISDNRRCFLDSNCMNRAACIAFAQANAQKSSLLLIAFNQIDMSCASFGQQDRRYHPWKPATTTQVDPVIG